MSNAGLTQLIDAITGGHIVGFFLVLTRVAPLFVLAPMFSAKQIPKVIKGAVGITIAVALTGVATAGQSVPTDPLGVAALVFVQLLVGTAFAFAIAATFAALEVAGSFIDVTSGFSYGSLINPLTGTQGAVITRIYTLVGTMLFIAIGGDAYLLRGIARTFSLVPLTAAPRLGPIVAGALQSFTTIFTAAIEVAGPVMLALLVTDISFGLVSRVVPQLNVFAVGLPVKIGVALLLVAAMLPFLGGWLETSLQNAVGVVLQGI